MSRVFAYIGILILLAVAILAIRQDDDDVERGPDLGEGYGYREDTLARFRLLLEDEGWTLTDPPRNLQGMLEAVHGKTGLTFVLVPAGSFEMGSPEDEDKRWDYKSEEPVHTVTVPAFLLCKTECTQRSWEKGGGTNESEFLRGADLPVEMVTWAECHDWCERNGLRLPSESEWEYACRAGSTLRWCFGDEESELVEYAWYYLNSGDEEYALGTKWYRKNVMMYWNCRTHSVMEKLPNPWGIFDMHGNVWEMCEDTWHNSYEGAPTDGSAWTTEGTPQRVTRGGGYYRTAALCRSAGRYKSYRAAILGFRPAAD